MMIFEKGLPKLDYFTFRTKSGCEETFNDVRYDIDSTHKIIRLYLPLGGIMFLCMDALEYYLYGLSDKQDAEIRVEVHEE